ncbi:GIY-YIG nuclease family protein [Citroniella saccharovorans]|uniref:GIY-YIG nuclease family protein n=1 Tax=Citroniella saccharovorans TaxID=2053367 RepID=A0AAW9MU65_9FIRM|nr:GIY-YIG nuclease family protein [Citroniella saccharovorans]MEB3429550.1 GIY-YIG nuclease family protein [Citroniella saccharovorans]
MFFVYILSCSDKTLYTGITNNLKSRLDFHNTGKASKYTRSRLPVKYVYIEEAGEKGSALSREIQIKKLSRKKKLELIKNSTNFFKEFTSNI